MNKLVRTIKPSWLRPEGTNYVRMELATAAARFGPPAACPKRSFAGSGTPQSWKQFGANSETLASTSTQAGKSSPAYGRSISHFEGRLCWNLQEERNEPFGHGGVSDDRFDQNVNNSARSGQHR